MVLIPLQISLILLEFPLQLPSIAVLSLSDICIQLPLKLPQLLPVATSESPLLLVENGFDVFCYPRLVVWLTMHSPRWDNAVHTEID